MRFSDWLRDECCKHDISLNALGEIVGLSHAAIFQYTKKIDPCVPRWSTFTKICTVFNADPKDTEKLFEKRILMDYEVTPLGKWLDGKLKEFGMSMRDLAKESGVSNKTLSGWKHGHADPRGSYYDRVVKVFDRKLEERQTMENSPIRSSHDEFLCGTRPTLELNYITVNGMEGLVNNAAVYDLHDTVVASGYPMRSHPCVMGSGINCRTEQRIFALGNSPIGSGHDNFLCGIRVAFDLTFTNKAWVEAERYHFFDIVSSQSTMHRIENLVDAGVFDERVDPRIIDILKELRDKAIETKDPEDRLKLLYNIPSGLKLTARITTNYRQLKTIYNQRKNHRLPEWRRFCEWIETLPYADIFLMKGDEEK